MFGMSFVLIKNKKNLENMTQPLLFTAPIFQPTTKKISEGWFFKYKLCPIYF